MEIYTLRNASLVVRPTLCSRDCRGGKQNSEEALVASFASAKTVLPRPFALRPSRKTISLSPVRKRLLVKRCQEIGQNLFHRVDHPYTDKSSRRKRCNISSLFGGVFWNLTMVTRRDVKPKITIKGSSSNRCALNLKRRK